MNSDGFNPEAWKHMAAGLRNSQAAAIVGAMGRFLAGEPATPSITNVILCPDDMAPYQAGGIPQKPFRGGPVSVIE